MEDHDHNLAIPAGAESKIPESVAPSDMSFVLEKDQPKSEAESQFDAELEKGDFEETQNNRSTEEEVENEYPKTFKLVTILVAVMLAVFLVALDMVSPEPLLESNT